ncbi:hypothetical protein TI39_contig408g00002 [Zymoseptoria brevis]|uniref:CCHC-type domain-containing protein n=1 Tax=Zymoseptoria brevis TaxID=1047168 RepID=A0A0F4GMR0_9PEZI|nr:hypothetical protein TI39_contig408g00002 [Zymoseptoria brevis]
MAVPINTQEIKVFTGNGEQDARRWMGIFKRRERNLGVSPETWLEYFDYLMDGAAGKWTDTVVGHLLNAPSEDLVEKVTVVFLKKWKPDDGTQDASAALEKIWALSQGADEILREYHERAKLLLQEADTPYSSNLTSTSAGVLTIAISSFKKGLNNRGLRAMINREPAMKTLNATVQKIESCQRQIESDERLRKEEQTQQEKEALAEYTTAWQPPQRQQTPYTSSYVNRYQQSQPEQQQQQQQPYSQQQQSYIPQQPQQSYAPQQHQSYPQQHVQTQQQPQLDHRRSFQRRDPGQSNQDHGQWYYDALTVVQSQFLQMRIDHSQSPNGFIDGQTPYRHEKGNPPCSKCGHRGHMPKECSSGPQQTPGAPKPRIVPVNLVDVMDEEEWTEEDLMHGILFIHQAIVCLADTGIDEQEREVIADVLATGFKQARADEDDGDEEREQTAVPCEKQKTSRPKHNKPQHQQTIDGQSFFGSAKGTKKTIQERKRKPMKLINAMFGQSPIDILQLLSKVMVEIPITWLVQLSPFFRNEIKRWFSQPRQRKSKNKDENGQTSLFDNAAWQAALRGAMKTFNAGQQHSSKQPSAQPTTPKVSVPTATSTPKVTALPAPSAPLAPAEQTTPKSGIFNKQAIELPVVDPMDESLNITVDTDAISTEVINSIAQWKKRNTTERAFDIPAVITGRGGQQVSVTRNKIAADQGSDINLMYPHMRKALGLPLHHISEIDSPYLNDINAVLNIRTSTITIGDEDRDEPTVALVTPIQVSTAPEVTVKPQQLEELADRISGESDTGSGEDSDAEDDDEDEEADGNDDGDTDSDSDSEEAAYSIESFFTDAPCRCGTERACTLHHGVCMINTDSIESDATPSPTTPNTSSEAPAPPKEFPTTCRVTRRPTDMTKAVEGLEAWIAEHKIKLGSCIPTEDKYEVMATLWTYRDLGATNVANMGPPSDLLQHRTRTREGAPIYRAKAKRLSTTKEWHLRNYATQGLESGHYERCVVANGELSRWNANAVLLPKEGQDIPRLTFDYNFVPEEPAGSKLVLMGHNHDFLALPTR